MDKYRNILQAVHIAFPRCEGVEVIIKISRAHATNFQNEVLEEIKYTHNIIQNCFISTDINNEPEPSSITSITFPMLGNITLDLKDY